MLDEIAIQQTLNRYTDGCNRADWQQVMATFLSDGVWEISGAGAHQGHSAIQAAMTGFLEQMDYFVQVNSPAVIDLDGDRASARSVIRECGKFAGRDEALEVLGGYVDELVRTESGWKFARRIFTSNGVHRFALLPGRAL